MTHIQPILLLDEFIAQQICSTPQMDLIPIRRTAEPLSILDATSSSYALRGWPANAAAHQCHHCKYDPLRFALIARPPSTNSSWPALIPKHSNNYVSASSTSSYLHSMVSFGFTLSSGATGNSSVFFDRKPSEEPGSNASAVQLKRLALGYFRIGDESFE